MTRLVMVGERSASPPAIVRTAAISCSGESSLRTNPLAPVSGLRRLAAAGTPRAGLTALAGP
jgi:hypothetical protein